jgi:hypothetical protein
MDELEKIRKQKHKEYLKQKQLPQITEKYTKLFNRENRAASVICKFVRMNYLHEVVNSDDLDYIPGVFRVRIRITNDNLNKPPIQEQNNSKNSVKQPQDDLDIVMQQSLEEFHKVNDDTLSKIIAESLHGYEDVDVDESYIEENIMNQIIMESLNTVSSFYLCIDLRVYGPNPKQPIFYNDVEYYLTNSQIERINKLWKRVDPETTTGIKFMQDLEYYKSLGHDMM